MIHATEAAALYVQPPYTETEIDEQIRRVAASRAWTCFDKVRLSEESRATLEANGYTLELSGTDYIVSWEKVDVPDLAEVERINNANRKALEEVEEVEAA